LVSRPTSPAAEATTTTGPRYGKRLSCLSTSSFLFAQLLAVYYRVFFEEGAVPTLHPATPDDPFLGRILATSIAPPHNVASIKSGLATHERMNYGRDSIRFFTGSPMDDTMLIDILKRTGAGSTPENAVAVIVRLPDDIADWGERPAFVDHDGPTGTQCRRNFSLVSLLPFIDVWSYHM
jgi:hypothetical protein